MLPLKKLTMPRMSTVALGLVSAALVTWFAAASTPGFRTTPPRVVDTEDLSAVTSALGADVLRLRQRLDDGAMPGRSTRNPFRYGDDRRNPSPSEVAEVPEAGAQVAQAGMPVQPEFMLVGMAEDAALVAAPVAATVQRTAILSGGGQILLVREGDDVEGRYRVTRVEAESVELTSQTDASVILLRLK